jgi:pimeloyl-ACP methyl ester carboxylesterase
MREHSSVAGLANSARGMLTQQDALVMERLANIDVPTLLLVGERDENFRAGMDFMSARIPNAEPLIVFEGAGHAANLERTPEFNAHLRRFLDGLPPE